MIEKKSFATKSLQIVEKMLALRKLSEACFAPAELARLIGGWGRLGLGRWGR